MDLSWLLVLVCPIMMIVMMFTMGGHHGSRKGHVHTTADPNVYNEIEKLKEQNEQLRKDIQKLS